ncbi:hypothetical protein BDQ17DRAFT_1350822 [Cyathus striatus]|nr:hypothetical protein BDQ17DRAFT_1350822 [Cyathus striatus]
MPPSDSECELLSAYPPSTPSVSDTEPDFDPEDTPHTLKTALSMVSESQLRALVLKLAESSPRFQHAIEKELSFSPPVKGTSSPVLKPSRRNKSRRQRGSTKSARSPVRCIDCGQRPETALTYESDGDECVYHPGVLEKKKFDCFSANADGQAVLTTQIYTMWSCCYEEETSPGCKYSPVHSFSLNTRSSEKTKPPGL